MKLKNFAVASLLAATSIGAFAADKVVTLNAAGPTYFDGLSTAASGYFDGGSDLLTFVGLAAGTYDVTISLSGTGVGFDGDLTTLNGVNATEFAGGTKKFSFMGLEATAASPFYLNLFGSIKDAKTASYSGQISFTSVSAVPEPTTYGMLLGGLGIMGFLARRKSKQA